MLKIIFDSSFLLAVVDRPTTWFEDLIEEVGKFDPTLLDCVRAELEGLAARNQKRSRAARVALDLVAGYSRMPCGGADVDDEIVSAALSAKAMVATIDTELQGFLRANHLRLVSLKAGRVAVS